MKNLLPLLLLTIVLTPTLKAQLNDFEEYFEQIPSAEIKYAHTDNLTLPVLKSDEEIALLNRIATRVNKIVNLPISFAEQGNLVPIATQKNIAKLMGQNHNDLYRMPGTDLPTKKYIEPNYWTIIANAFELKAHKNKTGELVAMSDCTDCDTNKEMAGHPAGQVESSTRGVASVVEVTDPNAHLGLDPAYIKYICQLAGHMPPLMFKNVENITSFEEALYVSSGKGKLLAALNKQSLPLPPESQEEIGMLWDEKYNEIFCPMSANFIPAAYIEIKLLMSGQTRALGRLYSDNHNYKLNINRLLKLNPYDSDEEATWVTLADLLKYYIENPVGQMTERQGLRDRFKAVYKIAIEKWGAKHAKNLNMTAEAAN